VLIWLSILSSRDQHNMFVHADALHVNRKW
jgi:hypothetical protein